MLSILFWWLVISLIVSLVLGRCIHAMSDPAQDLPSEHGHADRKSLRQMELPFLE
jgi:hypothetical protein